MENVGLIAAAVLATAMAAHEINRGYCASLGDDSQKPWDEAPEWQQNSAVLGVEFHIANPDADASASHDSWMAQKVADGWVYGEVKDEAAKTHPCILPFDQLPSEQQLKDVLFKATVHAVYPLFAVREERISDQLETFSAASREIGVLTSGKGELETELSTARKEVDRLTAELAKAEQKASVAPKAQKAPKARAAGPIKDPVIGVELRELLRESAVEIVFSDGKKEIAGLPALQVAGPAWGELSGDRLVLREAQTIKADRTVDLAGFALFDADGVQIGWCELPNPIPLSAGMQVRLDRQILFG